MQSRIIYNSKGYIFTSSEKPRQSKQHSTSQLQDGLSTQHSHILAHAQVQECETKNNHNLQQNVNQQFLTKQTKFDTCSLQKFSEFIEIFVTSELDKYHSLNSELINRDIGNSAISLRYNKLQKLKDCKLERIKVAADFFGQLYVKEGLYSSSIMLPTLSCEAISLNITELLLKKIDIIEDGLIPHRQVKKTIPGWFSSTKTLVHYPDVTETEDLTIPIDVIPTQQNITKLFEDLSDKLFIYDHYMSSNATAIGDDYVEIIYKQWFNEFKNDHNKELFKLWLNTPIERDHLRTIINPFVKQLQSYEIYFYTRNLFNILQELNTKNLIPTFHWTHVQHAQHIGYLHSVYEMTTIDEIKDPYISLLLQLAKALPASIEEADLSLTFCHHFLRYAAQHHLQLSNFSLETILHFFHKIKQICTNYQVDNDIKGVDRLINCFMRHIITRESLSVAPVKAVETFFEGLNTLIKHAVNNNCLQECFESLPNISLAWRDAPFALIDGFISVADEMQLTKDNIDIQSGRYKTFNASELATFITQKSYDHNELKVALFRYLGKTNLRHTLSYYRQIMNLCTPIDLIVCGIYILLTTGVCIGREFNQQILETKINLLFANDHALLSQLQVNIPIFLSTLASIPVPKITQKKSLWQIYISYPDVNTKPKKSTDSSITRFISLFTNSSQTTPMPVHLTRSFNNKRLYDFLTTNKHHLLNCSEFLKDYELFATVILIKLIKQYIPEEHYIDVGMMFKIGQVVPTFENFLNNLDVTHHFLTYCNRFITRPNIKEYINALVENIGIHAAGKFLQLFTEQGKRWDKIDLYKESLAFIEELKHFPTIIQNFNQKNDLLILLIEFYFHNQPSKSLLSRILHLSAISLSLEDHKFIISTILTNIRSRDGEEIFQNTYAFTPQQLHQIATLINHTKFSTNLIKQWLLHTPERDLQLLVTSLVNVTKPHAEAILVILNIIFNATNTITPDHLKRLSSYSIAQLESIDSMLRNSSPIYANNYLQILINTTSDIDAAIDALEQNLLSMKTQSPLDAWNLFEVADKLSTVKELNTQESHLQPSKQQYMRFLRMVIQAYHTKIVINAELSLPLKSLNRHQCQQLYTIYSQQLNATPNDQQVFVNLVALFAEIIYRTTNQFPRPIQLITLFNTFKYNTPLLHQLPTGSGKSLVIALHALYFHARKQTRDILTQNDQLARDGLRNFKRVFDYLNIPCAKDPITLDDKSALYFQGQVHYITVENRVFLEYQQHLSYDPKPLNPGLLIDEADLMLNTHLECNFAASLKKTPDIILWNEILKKTLCFVQEKEIFLNNNCSPEDDCHNLRIYLSIFLGDKYGKSLRLILDDLKLKELNSLIESSLITHTLQEKIDYVILAKDTNTYYAAPLLKQTNRPSLNVSYGSYVQSLLHAQLSERYPFINFEQTTNNSIILSAHPSILLNISKKQHAIGFTATAGTNLELQSLKRYHAIHSIAYPADYAGNIEILPINIAQGYDEQCQMLVQFLKDWRQQNPSHIYLIFAPSPKYLLKLRADLNNYNVENIDIYEGYDQIGSIEEDAINRAGNPGNILLTTPALSRGLDVISSCSVIINLCANIDSTVYIQMMGRTGRNNQYGYFLSILDKLDLPHSPENRTEFLSYWDNYRDSLNKQLYDVREQSRRKQNMRQTVIFEHVFPLFNDIKKLLLPWYGQHYSIVNASYINTDHNKFDIYWLSLLKKIHDDLKVARNIDEAIAFYKQNVLNKWITLTKYSQTIITKRPLILPESSMIAKLHTLTVADLTAISGFFMMSTENMGYREFSLILQSIQTKKAECLQKYLNGGVSWLSALIIMYLCINNNLIYKEDFKTESLIITNLEKLKSIPTLTVIDYISQTQAALREHNLDDALQNMKEWLKIQLWRIKSGTDIFFGMQNIFTLNFHHIHWQAIIIDNILWFLELSDPTAINIEIYVKKIDSIVENPELLSHLEKIINPEDKHIITKLIMSWNKLKNLLRPFNQKMLRDLLSPGIIFKIFVSMMADINTLNILGNKIISRFKEKNLDICTSLDMLSIAECLDFIIIFSHAKLDDFLRKLPPTMSLPELAKHLNSWEKQEELPYEVQDAFLELHTEQQVSTAKINAEEAIKSILNKHTLTAQTLKYETAFRFFKAENNGSSSNADKFAFAREKMRSSC